MTEYLLSALIAFAAALLKGVTGTGLGTIVVSFSSLIIGAKPAVVLSGVLGLLTGLVMYRADSVRLPARYLAPIALGMCGGMAVGAYLLGVMPHGWFSLVLGGSFFAYGVWFILRGGDAPSGAVPERASALDAFIGFTAGVSTGFVGISLPILFWYFGRDLPKAELRRLIVLMLIPGAMVQVAGYAAGGLIDRQMMLITLASFPALLAGVWAGGRVFVRLPETGFRRVMAALLTIISLKLIFFP